MILTFLVPNVDRPYGGVMAIYEFASGMARRGHEVHLAHLDTLGHHVSRPSDIEWCDIDPAVEQHFLPIEADLEQTLPAADFVFCFDQRVPDTRGLPLMFVQAFYVLAPPIEERIYEAPCPKLCTSRWLQRIAIAHGVPPHQALHLPYGIKHEKYRVLTPIEQRPDRVAILYSNHYTKRPLVGLAALERAREILGSLDVVVFGNTGIVQEIPDWMDHRESPSQDELVEDIYNGSKAFVSPSLVEGFGLAAVEAMACGCALVSTANGGSSDYAWDGETALVCEPDDVETMAQNIVRVVRDDELRHALVGRALDLVPRFDWDTSAEIIEQALRTYGADPEHFRQPNGPPSHERADLLQASILAPERA